MCSWQEGQAVGPLLSGGTAFDHTHAHVNWNLGGNFLVPWCNSLFSIILMCELSFKLGK